MMSATHLRRRESSTRPILFKLKGLVSAWTANQNRQYGRRAGSTGLGELQMMGSMRCSGGDRWLMKQVSLAWEK
jgi:hypothetical protein